MNYGRAIRTMRAARELSQKDLAKLADLNPSYISLVESGNRTPSTSAMMSIARALSVPPFLLSLIASDAEDLRGVDVQDAEHLGSHLLALLTNDAS